MYFKWLNIIHIIVLGALLYSQIKDKGNWSSERLRSLAQLSASKRQRRIQANLTQPQLTDGFNGNLREINFLQVIVSIFFGRQEDFVLKQRFPSASLRHLLWRMGPSNH